MATEGVIKYKLKHRNAVIDNNIYIAELNAWRTILYKLTLIGQFTDRYDGYSYGNISQRLVNPLIDQGQFVITGTQTGHIQTLSNDGYCIIVNALPSKNYIESVGKIKPSSEALTHASIYQQNKAIKSVVHIHNPDIWRNTKTLDLSYTDPDVKYGTPEMANEVTRLFNTENFSHTGVFSMLGHKDGIIAFSNSIQTASQVIIDLYTKALVIAHNSNTSTLNP